MKYLDVARTAIDRYHAFQKPTELAMALILLEDQGIKRVVEIGSAHGGSLWAWAQIPTVELVVSIDNAFGGYDFVPNCHEIRGDSSDQRTEDELVKILGGVSADFLFIDGHHSYASVAQDYRRYKKHVAGIVGFHDIVAHNEDLDVEVERVWQKVKGEEYIEIVHDKHEDRGWGTWGGIGLTWRS